MYDAIDAPKPFRVISICAPGRVLGPRFVDLPMELLWFVAGTSAVILYQLFSWLVRRFLLNRDARRGLALRQFSADIAHNPAKDALLAALAASFAQVYGDRPACLFLLDEKSNAFVPAYPAELSDSVGAIGRADACAAWFATQSGCVRTRQMRALGVEPAPDKAEMMLASCGC